VSPELCRNCDIDLLTERHYDLDTWANGKKANAAMRTQMRGKGLVLGFFAPILLIASSIYGQFTAEEIAQRAQWEEFLQTADITKYELIEKERRAA